MYETKRKVFFPDSGIPAKEWNGEGSRGLLEYKYQEIEPEEIEPQMSESNMEEGEDESITHFTPYLMNTHRHQMEMFSPEVNEPSTWNADNTGISVGRSPNEHPWNKGLLEEQKIQMGTVIHNLHTQNNHLLRQNQLFLKEKVDMLEGFETSISLIHSKLLAEKLEKEYIMRILTSIIRKLQNEESTEFQRLLSQIYCEISEYKSEVVDKISRIPLGGVKREKHRKEDSCVSASPSSNQNYIQALHSKVRTSQKEESPHFQENEEYLRDSSKNIYNNTKSDLPIFSFAENLLRKSREIAPCTCGDYKSVECKLHTNDKLELIITNNIMDNNRSTTYRSSNQRPSQPCPKDMLNNNNYYLEESPNNIKFLGFPIVSSNRKTVTADSLIDELDKTEVDKRGQFEGEENVSSESLECGDNIINIENILKWEKRFMLPDTSNTPALNLHHQFLHNVYIYIYIYIN